MNEQIGPRRELMPNEALTAEFVTLLGQSIGHELQDPDLTSFRDEDGQAVLVVVELVNDGELTKTTHYTEDPDGTVTKYFDVMLTSDVERLGTGTSEDLAYRDALLATGLSEAEAWAEIASEKLRRPSGDEGAERLLRSLVDGVADLRDEEALGLSAVSANELRSLVGRVRRALNAVD